MSDVDTRYLEAVVCLAEKELSRSDSHERAGALRTLLSEALPFLKNVLASATTEVAS